MNLKNFKIVRKLKDLSPKLKWAMFSSLQDCKIASRYIDYLIRKQPEEFNQVGFIGTDLYYQYEK